MTISAHLFYQQQRQCWFNLISNSKKVSNVLRVRSIILWSHWKAFRILLIIHIPWSLSWRKSNFNFGYDVWQFWRERDTYFASLVLCYYARDIHKVRICQTSNTQVALELCAYFSKLNTIIKFTSSTRISGTAAWHGNNKYRETLTSILTKLNQFFLIIRND